MVANAKILLIFIFYLNQSKPKTKNTNKNLYFYCVTQKKAKQFLPIATVKERSTVKYR